jgi:NTE family protein
MPPKRADITAEYFTEDEQVIHLIDGLWRDVEQKHFSDLQDDDGNEYVDLVMEGGGVLGIALVGYTYVLESVGIRFVGLGGTSAGSINALALCAAGPMGQARSERVLEVLAKLDMYDLVDGDSDARDFVDALVERSKMVKLAWKGMQVVDNIVEDLGLNPGKAFEDWLANVLHGWRIRTNADLERRRSKLPRGLAKTDGEKIRELMAPLVIIAAEVTTESKVIFPEMADLFWADPQSVAPEQFVRASMSIPFFFHPFRVEPPRTPARQRARAWANRVGYLGVIPDEAVFVDGGIMSNFPINVFHTDQPPSRPTFGVKLGTDRSEPHAVEKPHQLLGAIFNSARHTLDYGFFLTHPDYKHLVEVIDTGEHHWLNFELGPEEQRDLFRRGARAAARFLRRFDWAAYKEVRRRQSADAEL